MIYKLSDDYFVRLLTEADVEGDYPSWFADQEVCRFNRHGKFFKTRAQFRAYVDASNQEDRIVWAICHVKDGHIGNITLQQISLIDRTAEFAILLGNKRHWGRGVGALASVQLLDHGFEKLNLTRIHCATAATNEGMIKLAGVLGMTLEGTRRQHLFLEGARVDVLEYGILRDEFRARQNR